MTYLAKGDTALSVSIAAVSTLVASSDPGIRTGRLVAPGQER